MCAPHLSPMSSESHCEKLRAPPGVLADPHEAAVGVLALAGRDPLRDDGAAGVLPEVEHLGAGVGLLVVVGDGDGVELADRVVPLQDAARVLPGDGRAGLHLRPRDLRVGRRLPALGDEVVDAALAVLVAGVPVLDRRVLDGRVVEGHQLDHRGVELVLVAHRRRAALQVAHRRALVGHQQRPLELPGLRRVDAEVGGQLHGALHALRDVGERAVGEDRRVERGVEVVGGPAPPSRGTSGPGPDGPAPPRRTSRRRCRDRPACP